MYKIRINYSGKDGHHIFYANVPKVPEKGDALLFWIGDTPVNEAFVTCVAYDFDQENNLSYIEIHVTDQ